MRRALVLASAILAFTNQCLADWVEYNRVDPMTDGVTVSRYVNDESNVPGAVFSFTCTDSKKFRLILGFGKDMRPFGQGSPLFIEYRVDKMAASSLLWWLSENRAALFIDFRPSDADHAAFLRAVRAGNRLVVRFSQQRGGPITAAFDIHDAGKALADVKAACGLSESSPED